MTVGAVPSTTPLDRWLHRFAPDRPPTSTAGAAVTIVLRDDGDDVQVLLIERAERASDPASGHVALPGGHVAERDGNLAITALRELEEEVGLGLADLAGEPRYVRTLLATRFGLRVGVFAGALGPTARTPAPADRAEVAHVFWLPRRALEQTRTIHRDTTRGSLEVPATVHESHVLWGFTRRVLREFFELPYDDPLGGPIQPIPAQAGDPPR